MEQPFNLGEALLSDVENGIPITQPEEQEPLSFPDIMSGAAGEYATVYSSVLEVPRHFLYISYLTCMGSVIAHKVTLNSEIAPQPRLFTLLLGESADDRKSTALSKTTTFFRDVLSDFQECWGIGSAEGLQKRLEGNPQLLLCFDEFKQFVSKCKIDGSVLLPCVNTLFETNRYESRTKNYDINLEDVYLCILAASTVQTYERTWDSSFTDIGFNNRLFLVPGSGKKKFSFPKKIASAERSWLETQLGEVLKHAEMVSELDITGDAEALFHEWYMGIERSIHSKRLETYAMRFMILLAINEGKKEIDAGIIDKVIRLMNWQLEVRKLHDPIDADGQMAKMEERVRRALRAKGTLTERELKRHTHADRSGLWVFSMAIKNLQDAGEILWNKNTNRWGLA